ARRRRTGFERNGKRDSNSGEIARIHAFREAKAAAFRLLVEYGGDEPEKLLVVLGRNVAAEAVVFLEKLVGMRREMQQVEKGRIARPQRGKEDQCGIPSRPLRALRGLLRGRQGADMHVFRDPAIERFLA